MPRTRPKAILPKKAAKEIETLLQLIEKNKFRKSTIPQTFSGRTEGKYLTFMINQMAARVATLEKAPLRKNKPGAGRPKSSATKCPKCEALELVKNGTNNGCQKFLCNACGYSFRAPL